MSDADESNDSDKRVHQQKMEVRRFYGGIFLWGVIGATEIFVEPVPFYLYAFALVVLGIPIDNITKWLPRK